jgi:hypothetical protein
MRCVPRRIGHLFPWGQRGSPNIWKQPIMTVMFQLHLSRFESYCFHIEDRAFHFHSNLVLLDKRRDFFIPQVISSRGPLWVGSSRIRLAYSILASGVRRHSLDQTEGCACIYADGIRKCSCPSRLRHIWQKAATADWVMEIWVVR